MKLVKSNSNDGFFFPSIFSDFFDGDNFFSKTWVERELGQNLPAVNIKESKDGFDIECAAPGFKKNDFKIDVEGNILSMSAEKQSEKSQEKEWYTRKEFTYNSFSRSFTLPQNANAEKIDAKYSDGILKLHISKKEEAKKQSKKQISVG